MSIKRFNNFPDGSGSLTSDDILLFMDDPTNSGVTKKIAFSQMTNGLVKSDVVGITGASGINNIVGKNALNLYDNITNNANE